MGEGKFGNEAGQVSLGILFWAGREEGRALSLPSSGWVLLCLLLLFQSLLASALFISHFSLFILAITWSQDPVPVQQWIYPLPTPQE